MGDVLYLFADGRWNSSKNGKPARLRMLEQLGVCTIEIPRRSGWVVTIDTPVHVDWFRNAIVVERNSRGELSAATINWRERLDDGRVRLTCDFSRRWVQNRGSFRRITAVGFYLVTPNDDWAKLNITN